MSGNSKSLSIPQNSSVLQMKKQLIIVFSILSLGISAQNADDWVLPDTLLDDSGRIFSIEERGGEQKSLYFEYSDSGLLQKETFVTWKDNMQYERITEYHKNGQMKTRYFWYIIDKTLFGKSSLDGMYSEYDEQGNLLQSIMYQNNKMNGEYVIYYPNGKPKSITTYINDLRFGKKTTYFSNGGMASELIYEKDRLMAAKYLSIEGQVFENKAFSQGEGNLFFYEFGELQGYCFFKNGKRKKCNCECY